MCTTTDSNELVMPSTNMKMSRSESDLMALVECSDSDISLGGNDTVTTAGLTSSLRDEECKELIEMETPSPSKMKKNVSFGNLAELSFPVVAGDPNFEMAYPMTLGWECLEESTRSIDDYEASRPTRRTSDELRTMSEDRRKIIKKCKKQSRHRRHNSISNGQIGKDNRRNRVQDFLTGSATPTQPKLTAAVEETPQATSTKKPSKPNKLRRQNSIGNGQITRDSRRNRVQNFMAGAKQSMAALSEKKTPSSPVSSRPKVRRQNSIGNGQIGKDSRRNRVQEFVRKMTGKSQ